MKFVRGKYARRGFSRCGQNDDKVYFLYFPTYARSGSLEKILPLPPSLWQTPPPHFYAHIYPPLSPSGDIVSLSLLLYIEAFFQRVSFGLKFMEGCRPTNGSYIVSEEDKTWLGEKLVKKGKKKKVGGRKEFCAFSWKKPMQKPCKEPPLSF